MIIEKKCWPVYFEKILNGRKTFEVRLGDFECAEGDILRLLEFHPIQRKYTGRQLERKITFIMNTNDVDFWTHEEIEEHGLMIIALKGEDEQ